ncbi:MAG: hypothetical protein IJ660_06780 [Alphaproteobacteria bacterium]|nr:hypothetical protein [Alphaproteobacteria bacterium]
MLKYNKNISHLRKKTTTAGAKAEPYKPQKVEKLGITAKVDLSGLPQYAENDKTNTASDAEYVLVRKENPSEKFLSQDFFDLLGFKESSSNYTKHYDDKQGVGAIGMYQFRLPALQEI